MTVLPLTSTTISLFLALFSELKRQKLLLTGTLEQLHNWESYNQHFGNITCAIRSSRKRWAEHVAPTAKMTNTSRDFVWKPQTKKPHGSLRHRLLDNIKMDPIEIVFEIYGPFRPQGGRK
jgi:hypothetical protein